MQREERDGRRERGNDERQRRGKENGDDRHLPQMRHQDVSDNGKEKVSKAKVWKISSGP